MYRFKVKADAKDIELPALRSLLGFALIIALLYRNQHNYYINISVLGTLAVILFFLDTILTRFRLQPVLVAGVAAILLFIATHAIIFSVLIFVFAVAIKSVYVQPTAEFFDTEIKIKKTFVNKIYQWDNFNNVVLKDNLLTLDFKNNRVLQLEIQDGNPDEKEFNSFCTKKTGA